MWYLVVVCRYGTVKTWTRYIDWVVSTPIMLFSTALFFHHRGGVPLGDIVGEYAMWTTIVLNWAMLAFGFLAEVDAVARPIALALGSTAFVASFTMLSTLIVDQSDPFSLGLFGVQYAVWGLYGVAAAFPYTPKNVAYNALDLVSKNGYGIFLFVYSLLPNASPSTSSVVPASS